MEAPMSFSAETHRHGHTRIRLRIPKQYQQEPIISNLITQHGLTVNIAAALLSSNARDDGWFDLELNGTVDQIQGGLLYLNDLNLEIWRESAGAEETW
jgi:hypothetical protein